MLLLNVPLKVLRLKALRDFNTSYVVIKPFETCAYTARYVNFNTSYVVIKLLNTFSYC